MSKLQMRLNSLVVPYAYFDTGTASGCIGVDGIDSNKLKIGVANSLDVNPTSVSHITINPSANGDIEFSPNGTGNLNLLNGSAVIVAGNLELPETTATEGIINIDSIRYFHAYGTLANIFVGHNSGNFTLTGTENTALGFETLLPLTTGSRNTAIGGQALLSCTSGSDNTAVGLGSGQSVDTGLFNTFLGREAGAGITSGSRNIGIGGLSLSSAVTTGTDNIAIGFNAGESLDTTDSSNILINHEGSPGLSNTMRLGTQGSGNGEIDTTYIAGVYGVTPAGATEAVIIDSDGQFGSVAASSLGFTWNEVTGTSQAAAVGNGYITNNAGLVTVTLPDTAALGSVVRVAGKGAGGWRVAQNAGETIHFGSSSTTTGVGGYLEFTDQYDAVELLCITADTEWEVLSSVGNLTVV